MAVETFTRIYAFGAGPEHQATPEFVGNVLRSMREAASSDVPFTVLFRMDDGSSVTVRPKRKRAAA